MKRHLKKMINPHHWVAFLRRQSHHMQRVYVTIISGTITGIIACIILYVDYGFWHEKYSKDDDLVVSTSTEKTKAESPTEMLSRFFKEAQTQFKAIDISPKNLLEGKEIYIKDDQSETVNQ